MKSIKLMTLAIAGLFFTSFAIAQTADDVVNKHIEAIGGKDNWKKITSMRSEATLSTQGIDIPVVISQVHNKAVKQEYTVMGMTGFSIISVDGGWNFNPMQGQTKPEPMTQDELNIGKEQLDIQGEFLDYKEKGHTIEMLANEDIDGVSCFKIKLTRKSGRESIYLFDPKSFYIIRTISKMTANGQEVESTVNFSNYQKLSAGVLIPFTMENNALPAPITMSKVEVNIKIEDTVFKVQQ